MKKLTRAQMTVLLSVAEEALAARPGDVFSQRSMTLGVAAKKLHDGLQQMFKARQRKEVVR